MCCRSVGNTNRIRKSSGISLCESMNSLVHIKSQPASCAFQRCPCMISCKRQWSGIANSRCWIKPRPKRYLSPNCSKTGARCRCKRGHRWSRPSSAFNCRERPWTSSITTTASNSKPWRRSSDSPWSSVTNSNLPVLALLWSWPKPLYRAGKWYILTKVASTPIVCNAVRGQHLTATTTLSKTRCSAVWMSMRLLVSLLTATSSNITRDATVRTSLTSSPS